MCGLVAVVERHRPVDRDRLGRAVAALRHRGPDVQATAIAGGGDSPEIGFGHARLSILDPATRSDQPFVRGGDTLVYNGEIYNFRDLSREMVLATAGDTEVLLTLLVRDGVAALALLNGMWAFVWHDARRRRLVAARDRFGKKPLFYAVSPERIALASTIDALTAVTGGRPSITPEAVRSYLAEGWLFPDSGGATHIEGIREVRPGHALTIDLDTWTLEETLVAPVDPGDPGAPPPDEDLAQLLEDAVRLRLIADRQIGLLLSGGVDSSLILSIMAAKGWLDGVITATGDDGKSEDARQAAESLSAVGATALTVPLGHGAAAFADFLAVCRHQQKPFPLIGNVLGMPALYRVMAEAGVRVALDGSGADEIFGGYWYRYGGLARREGERSRDEPWLARLESGGMLPRHLTGAAGGVLPGPEPVDGADMLLKADVVDGLSRLARRDPLHRDPGSLRAGLIADVTGGRMQEWLWQNDRNAMMYGIENRCPFLDHRLARWLSAPYRTKFDGARNKPLLRDAFSAFRPLGAAARLPKQGFRFRYTRFIQANAETLRDLVLSEAITRPLLAPNAADSLARDPGTLIFSSIFQRLAVLAGLGHAGGLASP